MSLESKKLRVELLRVGAAKAELEFRIEESMENIARLNESVAVQQKKEVELQAKIEELEKQ